jgi:hypothetical protein
MLKANFFKVFRNEISNIGCGINFNFFFFFLNLNF